MIKKKFIFYYFIACNVLATSLTEPYTLRNYGRRINCTYVALYPGSVQVIALGVGVSNFLGSTRTTETGTIRKVCTPFILSYIYIYIDIGLINLINKILSTKYSKC